MKRLLPLAAAAAGFLFPLAAGTAESEVTPPASTSDAVTAQAPAAVTVVGVRYHRPARVLRVRTRFRPWARPSVAQVHRIIAIEAARWGVSPAGLSRRIGCESSFEWDNEYAGHYGLGQFLPGTWARAISSMPRLVMFRVKRVRVKRVLRLRTMSDGSVRLSWRWGVRQRVVHEFRGMLPARPGIWHGWAQVRGVARALAGRGNVGAGEWSCGA